jgi:dienelactone hydrolase
MRAFVCQSLDWCAIQLATRYVQHAAAHPSGQALPDRVLGNQHFCPDSNSPRIELIPKPNGAFSFPSTINSAFQENNTVFGRLFRADEEWAGYPAVILLHGWNASLCYRHTQPRLARRLVRSHVNVAMIELPYHMQRRPARPKGVDFLSGDLVATLQAAKQALADLRALLDWLFDQGVPKVGLWGFSLGAWLAGLMARFDPRLHFAVLTTPMARIDRAMNELAFCEPIRQSMSRVEVDLSWLNLASEPPCMNPSNILLMASQYDRFAPPETVEELWRAWVGTEIWRLPHGHISILASPAPLRQASDWIVRKAMSPSGYEKRRNEGVA